MKKIVSYFPLLLICFYSFAQKKVQDEKNSYMNSSLPVEQRVALLLAQMTLEEKIGQMCQYVGEAARTNTDNRDELVGYKLGMEDKAELIRKGLTGSFLKVPGYKEANYLQELALQSRLKIPLLIATDAIHGHGMDLDIATIFPTPIGIAASFDTLLAQKIASSTAKEMRATGFHWTFSPNLDLTHDARWGRNGETFGEDPLLITSLGVSMIHGYQGKNFSGDTNVLSCVKHLVAGGIADNGLNGAPADVSERTLQELFYPPFRKAIGEQAYTLMPAHNEVNGVPCHADRKMLTGMLRKEWGFNGFVVSDWRDIENLHTTHKIAATRKEADGKAVLAGVDMHMHGGLFLDNIKALVEEGKIPISRIDEAAGKILEAKFRLGLFENRFSDPKKIKKIVACHEHRELALEAARKSIVLLKNENQILPLKENITRILVTGPNADDQSLLGDWSRIQPDANVVTVLEGLRQTTMARIDYLPCGPIHAISDSALAVAKEKATLADVIIMVGGENSIRENPHRTSGENIDRASLILQGRQPGLIRTLASSGKPVILVLINGSPVSTEDCDIYTSAIIEAWEPGMQGGLAVAEVLFGKYNPSGKLPITIPANGQIRSYYNYKPSAYHRGKFKFNPVKPLYNFGYGLSYTSFEYNRLTMKDTLKTGEAVKISVDVRNTGQYAGDEIVMLYINDVYSSVTTPVKSLKAFQRISLKPGETKTVSFTLDPDALSLLDADLKRIVEPGEFKIIFGDQLLTGSFWVK